MREVRFEQVFAAGFSLAVYALFRMACDFGGVQLTLFRVLGANALAGYIAHGIVGGAVGSFVPRDAPLRRHGPSSSFRWEVAPSPRIASSIEPSSVRCRERASQIQPAS
jgi:hypothetical protein